MTRRFIKSALHGRDTSTLAGREYCGKLSGAVGIIVNLLLSISKLAAGFMSGSISITADAVNNLSDAGSSVVTFVGFRLSGKPADRDHPYGHARYEYLSGLIVSLLILLIGFSTGKSSVEKIINPQPTQFMLSSVIILCVSVVAKLWLTIFNGQLGKMIGSEALEATSADCRNDVISTTAVIASTLISRFTPYQTDGWFGLLVSVFIIWSGICLTKETIGPLLGQAPDEKVCKDIAQLILSYDKVLGIHDLIVHSYGPGSYFASVHIEIDANENILVAHDVLDAIERDFLEKKNIHLVAHLDPTVTDDELTNELHTLVDKAVKEFDPQLTIHDFRVVLGEDHKNVLFDVVIPPDYKFKDDEVKQIISKKIRQFPGYNIYAVIDVDRSYNNLT